VNMTMAELQAASVCHLVRLFPTSSLPLGQAGDIRALHGDRCGWCELDLAELRQLRAINQPSRREEAAWWNTPAKTRRKALEKAMARIGL